MTTRVAVDTETTGLNVWQGDQPFMVTACFENGDTLLWEWDVEPKTRKVVVPKADRKEVQDLVGDPAFVKEFWNAKFDILMLESIGIIVDANIAEVSFMARAVNNLELAYALKPLSKKYIGIGDDDEDALVEAVKACRKIVKPLGWNIATKESHGDTPVHADYWLPKALAKFYPKKARAVGISGNECEVYGLRDVERTLVMSAFYRHAMKDLDTNDPRVVLEVDPADTEQTIKREKLATQAVYEREMALLPLTIDMERHGVRIHKQKMMEAIAESHKRLSQARSILEKAAGTKDFNHNSGKQVAALLFEKNGSPVKNAMKLPVKGRTKTGVPKTGADALKDYMHSEPIVAAVLGARAAEKSLSTFFLKYQELAVEDEDGLQILHPGFQQWGTLTGRYTCKNPNLQQVSNPNTTNSKAASFVVNVREVFAPRPGYRWYCPDYSQVEVIIFADISNESTLLNAIRTGSDIHTATGNKVWGKGSGREMEATLKLLQMHDKYKSLTFQKMERAATDLLDKFDGNIIELEASIGFKIWRKLAKTVTFAKIFGGGTAALIPWIGCTKEEALKMLSDYDSAFPEMKAQVKQLEAMGSSDGFVVNRYGRKLGVDPWHAHRAVNYIVQSSAADLMKDGMRKCAAYLKKTGLRARIVMTVHDELIFEFHRDDCFKHVLRKLCEIMADHEGHFNVPTPVDMERVDTYWSEKHKVEL